MLKLYLLCLLLTLSLSVIDFNFFMKKVINKHKNDCIPSVSNRTCFETYECCNFLKCHEHKCIPNYRCLMPGFLCQFDNECCSNICTSTFSGFGTCHSFN